MEMKLVESSNMHSVGYDSETSTLMVKFKADGPIFDYADVPSTEHERLMAAQSKGKHFAVHIKGAYKCTKRKPVVEEIAIEFVETT